MWIQLKLCLLLGAVLLHSDVAFGSGHGQGQNPDNNENNNNIVDTSRLEPVMAEWLLNTFPDNFQNDGLDLDLDPNIGYNIDPNLPAGQMPPGQMPHGQIPHGQMPEPLDQMHYPQTMPYDMGANQMPTHMPHIQMPMHPTLPSNAPPIVPQMPAQMPPHMQQQPHYSGQIPPQMPPQMQHQPIDYTNQMPQHLQPQVPQQGHHAQMPYMPPYYSEVPPPYPTNSDVWNQPGSSGASSLHMQPGSSTGSSMQPQPFDTSLNYDPDISTNSGHSSRPSGPQKRKRDDVEIPGRSNQSKHGRSNSRHDAAPVPAQGYQSEYLDPTQSIDPSQQFGISQATLDEMSKNNPNTYKPSSPINEGVATQQLKEMEEQMDIGPLGGIKVYSVKENQMNLLYWPYQLVSKVQSVYEGAPVPRILCVVVDTPRVLSTEEEKYPLTDDIMVSRRFRKTLQIVQDMGFFSNVFIVYGYRAKFGQVNALMIRWFELKYGIKPEALQHPLYMCGLGPRFGPRHENDRRRLFRDTRGFKHKIFIADKLIEHIQDTESLNAPFYASNITYLRACKRFVIFNHKSEVDDETIRMRHQYAESDKNLQDPLEDLKETDTELDYHYDFCDLQGNRYEQHYEGVDPM